MTVISTTLCYPNATSPTQGVFVRRRLSEIHRLRPVRVIAPVPWFPGLPSSRQPSSSRSLLSVDSAQSASLPHEAASFDPDVPTVAHPRMFYLPGIAKGLDGRFYARAFDRAIDAQAGPDSIELVDAHFVWPDGVGAWRVARRRGLPFVCTIRGKLVSQIRERSKRQQIREMLREADGLIAVSRSLATLADEVAEREVGATVIPNGIDPALFRQAVDRAEARAAMGWSASARYVVSVGHWQALKGFHRLIGIWPELRRRCGDVRLVLVGGDAGEPAYAGRWRHAAATLGADAVSCAGVVSPERVATMLNAADLFVLASRSEGWCNAIAESLACGCPVVATDVGGNREIMHDPRLGRLVPYGDDEAMLEAIGAALSDDWDRPQIAEIGGRRTWQQVARECVDVFDAVLERRG